MTTYRNDLNAAIARADQLERELAAARAELEAVNSANVANTAQSVELEECASADEVSNATEAPLPAVRDFTTALTLVGLSAIAVVVAASMRSWTGLGIIAGLATIWTTFGLYKHRS